MIEEATLRIAPLLNTTTMKRLAVIDVTTTSAVEDLTTRLTKVNDGHYYTFRADGGTVYLAFNNANSGAVDETVTASGVTECFSIPDGSEEDWVVPDGFTYLVVKGSAACKLRIALSSKNPNQQPLKNEL